MTETLERGFSTAEFEARASRLRRACTARIGGAIGHDRTRGPILQWLSNLVLAKPNATMVSLRSRGWQPTAIIPEIGAELMKRSWVDDIRTWSAPNPEDDGISLLTDLLAPYAAAGQTIGVMKGHETHLRMPLSDWEKLQASLPGLKIGDATGLLQGLRMVKSDAEIAKLRHICAIGSATFANVPNFVAEGMPLDQVFREFRREALAQGADDAPYVVGGLIKAAIQT